MKYAIIAAGEGSRLAQEGLSLPKPLVSVGGESLLARLLRIFHEHEAEEVLLVLRASQHETRTHVAELAAQHPEWRLQVVLATPPSSMHSLAALQPWLGDAPFCLTTVDTIFRETDFAAYVAAFTQALDEGWDGLMGVTGFVDDEKPLYVSASAEGCITGFHDEAQPSAEWVSGGIYGLTPRALSTLSRCMVEGQHRLRNFQRALVADGLRLRAYVFPKILDVDHVSDIAKAEEFLQHTTI